MLAIPSHVVRYPLHVPFRVFAWILDCTWILSVTMDSTHATGSHQALSPPCSSMLSQVHDVTKDDDVVTGARCDRMI
jgi:hypothetical protein